jgi:rubredoxin
LTMVKLKREIDVKGWKCDGCGREVAPEHENFDGWMDIACMRRPEQKPDPLTAVVFGGPSNVASTTHACPDCAAAANEFMRMRTAKATS